MNNYKVGDKVFIEIECYNYIFIEKVTKVTPKYFFVNNIKFRTDSKFNNGKSNKTELIYKLYDLTDKEAINKHIDYILDEYVAHKKEEIYDRFDKLRCISNIGYEEYNKLDDLLQEILKKRAIY